MLPKTFTATSAGPTTPVPLNWRGPPFNTTLAVTIPSGTLTYTVEHSFDDPRDGFTSSADYGTNATWHDTTDLTALSASAAVSLISPVRAVRLNVTAYTSGSAEFTIIQSNM